MSDNTENQAPLESSETVPAESKMTIKQKSRIVIMTLLALVLITFVVQNSNRVELEFLNINFRVRIIFIILASAIVGALINFLLMKNRAARKRKKKK
ncbi:MAG: putative integral membrane protein [Crocinitomix sp.]|jgi:uncharacterized integral membrane protein